MPSIFTVAEEDLEDFCAENGYTYNELELIYCLRALDLRKRVLEQKVDVLEKMLIDLCSFVGKKNDKSAANIRKSRATKKKNRERVLKDAGLVKSLDPLGKDR